MSHQVDYAALATGKWYEDLEPGLVIKSAITRTVTETDNLLFSALTHNSAWLHLDEEYCKTQMFKTRIVNSMFTLSLLCGIQVADVTLGTTLANLGFSDIKFPKPVFFGDTIYVETEVLGRRESKSRPDAGIVDFEHRGINQRGETVAVLRRQGLMSKRPAKAA
ncbi:MaoC family dehydratase [Paracoccus versutus]|uniref:Acyl dehydratase n=1 Tax=Paracoccus versutus TaxID=34007 RepID=A0A3D9XDR2_PARVE|nr:MULTISPECIES: MaoC family dehydratase [Paracoccus]SFY44453.1 Acyl dehydratase [Paracoccus pantotrophus]MBT0778719.1 MaoC family dehydratase [Paracoccus sp. pheM1]REF68715.1 acyl dehydratase [Paracoccus versutus]REG29286.1 acyl dehydratase [Paracoccus versutus]WEJ79632.1 MaoC family dehydratase [Paracoccus versutus]